MKALKSKVKYKAGRNNSGRITMRHKGGRVKRAYRFVDFRRDKMEVPGEVQEIQYDPNRSANIALVKYIDGEFRYIIVPDGVQSGDKVITSTKFQGVVNGYAYPLKVMPPATFVHNIELVPGKGGIIARSAGVYAQVQGQTASGYVQLKLPSGEVRLVNGDCIATVGIVGNKDHSAREITKAGTKRLMGVKPTVRGVAQSYKHPHGGGQGKSGRHGTGGPSKDPWGNKRGKITRNNKNTNKYIISRKTSKLRPKNKPYKTLQ